MVTVISIVVGALGTVSKNLSKILDELEIRRRIAFTFTFGLIPFGKGFVSAHLWVKGCHYCSSQRMVLALNNPRRLIYHFKRKKTNQKKEEKKERKKSDEKTFRRQRTEENERKKKFEKKEKKKDGKKERKKERKERNGIEKRKKEWKKEKGWKERESDRKKDWKEKLIFFLLSHFDRKTNGNVFNLKTITKNENFTIPSGQKNIQWDKYLFPYVRMHVCRFMWVCACVHIWMFVCAYVTHQ